MADVRHILLRPDGLEEGLVILENEPPIARVRLKDPNYRHIVQPGLEYRQYAHPPVEPSLYHREFPGQFRPK